MTVGGRNDEMCGGGVTLPLIPLPPGRGGVLRWAVPLREAQGERGDARGRANGPTAGLGFLGSGLRRNDGGAGVSPSLKSPPLKGGGVYVPPSVPLRFPSGRTGR